MSARPLMDMLFDLTKRVYHSEITKLQYLSSYSTTIIPISSRTDCNQLNEMVDQLKYE